MDSSRSRIDTLLAASVAVFCLFAVPITQATNLGFLKDSPVSYFDDEDMRLLREAALKILLPAEIHLRSSR